jgi:exonuclease III
MRIKLDIVALTETWLKEGDLDMKVIGDITPKGYVFHHIPRKARKGGGVAVLCREVFKLKTEPLCQAASFEALQILVTAESVCIRLVVLYRIPPSSQNGISKASFLNELEDLVEHLANSTGKLLILGDFNTHWDKQHDTETAKLSNLLKAFNLSQHVREQTHQAGHIIDLVISRDGDNLVSSCDVNSLISDHHAIHLNLACTKPHLSTAS